MGHWENSTCNRGRAWQMRRGASDLETGFRLLIFVQFAQCKYHDR
jgi:hypothetical protein